MAEQHLFKHINGSLYGIVCLNNIFGAGRERELQRGRGRERRQKHLFEGK